jgi:hypothetical protein
MIQAEGIADGENPFADSQLVGIAEGDDGQNPVRLDFDQGDICVGIPPFDFGVIFFAAGQFYPDLVGFFHHMIIREDVAVAGNDESRAETPLFEFPFGKIVEKPAEEFIAAEKPVEWRFPAWESSRSGFNDFGRADVHNSRTELLCQIGK